MARRIDAGTVSISSVSYDKKIRKEIEDALRGYLLSLRLTTEGVGRRERIPGNYVYERDSCFSIGYFRDYLRRKSNILIETADDIEEIMAMAMDLMFGPKRIGKFVIIPETMDSNISFVILRYYEEK